MILAGLSYVYRAGVALRNAAYDMGLLTAHPAGIPVLSVGNITAGGTGKTPVVEFLLRSFVRTGLRVAVVTRGYKRGTRGYFPVSDGAGRIADAASGGDEPVQIARKFPRAVVIADESRVRGCRRARSDFGAELILLDDGYQHRACARDLDVVVLDSGQPLPEQRLLPAGRLREPLQNLSRADLVILSKCDPGRGYDRMVRDIGAYTSAPVVATQFIPERLRDFRDEAPLDPQTFNGKSAFLFSGIGAPASFSRTAAMLGIVEAGRIDFPDHHAYRESDIARIGARFRESGASLLLTTEKDAVRLATHRPLLETLHLYYPEMAVRLLSGEEDFHALLDATILRRTGQHSKGTP